MNKQLDHFIENLDNTITDSEMDTGDSYMCEICRSTGGDEALRDRMIHTMKEKIGSVLGEEAKSIFMDDLIKAGSTCTSKPIHCNKFQNE